MLGNEKNDTVVITGRNYGNILGMVRAFGEAGYAVEVLRVFRSKLAGLSPLNQTKPEKYSKYVSEYRECIASEADSDVVCTHLLEMAGADIDKRLLIAVDDHLLSAIEEHRTKLSAKYLIPGDSCGERTVTQLMDKALQKEIAGTYGVPMLNGATIHVKDGDFKIPPTVTYPCFIKANVSMKGSKTKMARCETKEELETRLWALSAGKDLEVMVEDFADIRAEYSIIGVSTGKEVASPGLIKSIVGGHRERAGVVILGELVADERFRALTDQCNEFIKGIHYTGIFDIDLIETKDGELYFVELNLRPGASTYALIKGGVNLAKMYADFVFRGVSIDTECMMVADSRRFVSEKNLYEEYLRGDISRQDAYQLMDMAAICFIKDELDPQPYEHFRRQCKRNAFMKYVYKIKH